MTTYFARIAGKVYGPFTAEQLRQHAASGRINAQTEVSTDKQTWVAAATVLGQSASGTEVTVPGFAGGSGGSSTTAGANAGDAKKYLEFIRNRTHYPFYRTTILICSILGYVVAGLPIVGLVFKVIWTGLSSVAIYEPIALLFASALIGVFVTVLREMFSMYADFVDSTLDHHSKRS